MAFIFGVFLFAIGIAVTIALHEWGHLAAARACGMRVRRYFIGFGPTIFSFRRHHDAAGGHETEYGVKAIPFGGFCDIAGMTAQDPISAEEKPYAMYAKPWWQRIIVLLGGVTMNLLVGIVLIYISALTWGLPNLNQDFTPTIADTTCVAASQRPDGSLEPCSGAGPAEQAGLRSGDVIVAINGHSVAGYPEAIKLIGSSRGDTVDITVERAGSQETFQVTPQRVRRLDSSGVEMEVPAIGIAFERREVTVQHYNAITAIGGTASFTGALFGAVWDGLLSIPEKVPGVVASVFGGQRDPASPMSVVGASRAGGELVEANQWHAFVQLLANLNFFLALFNLVPLPPLDGGHIAVVLYERLRDAIRRALGKPALGPADYTKLLPVTVAFTAVLLTFGLIVIAADVVNPIRLF